MIISPKRGKTAVQPTADIQLDNAAPAPAAARRPRPAMLGCLGTNRSQRFFAATQSPAARGPSFRSGCARRCGVNNGAGSVLCHKVDHQNLVETRPGSWMDFLFGLPDPF